MMKENIRIGIIGGSGLYEMEALTNVSHVSLDTPFGAPSEAYIIGTLEGSRVAFLPRHGRGHRISPSELNFRANIYGFKMLGVEHIISATAVGSLKEHICPLDIVVPDQFYDRTKQRVSTFFGNGLVAHISFADPVCPHLSSLVYKSAAEAGAAVHKGGTLVCIEGPAFSTKAESNVYRQWGMDIVGMTSLQEAKLAREAEICYAAMAMVTDFDSWHEEESEVTVEAVVQNLEKNISVAKKIIQMVVQKISKKRACICAMALKESIMTDSAAISQETRKKLELLVGKYLKD
ncbi:MAG: S-methyl-5'-thioadenosine phosphorylase [Desulfobacterales bacterium]|nr:MAG: S-methyl-5'-thioadenosine phosphorylase [Desulfobacterales bacterium]